MKITLISTSPEPREYGLRTISSVLKNGGYEVKIIFMKLGEDYYKLYNKKELRQLKNLCKNNELIGIGCMALTYPKALQIMKYLKKELDIPIILGGPQVTLNPEQCIKECNIVCIGEGEGAMLDVANAIKNKKPLNKIKNIWTRENNQIMRNEVRDLVDNLDKLPYPDFDIINHHILDKGKIRRFKKEDLNNEIVLITSRGCPYGCAYCSNGKFNEIYKNHRKKIVRSHSIDYIIRFIKLMKDEFNLKHIGINDDSFTLRSLKEIKDFSKRYKNDIGIPYKCTTDAKTITEDNIKELINSGCNHITLGIQGSERVNKEVYKRYIDNRDIIRTAKRLYKYKDKCVVSYDLIINNPYEENEDILNVFKLIKELPKPFRLQCNTLEFFAGSKLYERAVNDRIIKSIKDTRIDVDHFDRGKPILKSRKNIYLNTLISLTRGIVTDQKYGSIDVNILNKLLQDKYIKFFDDKNKLTLIFPYSLLAFDFIKYKIFKRIYNKSPYKFKKWFTNKLIRNKILITKDVI